MDEKRTQIERLLRPGEQLVLLTRFWRYVRPHWRLTAVLVIVVPIGTGLGILPPYLIVTLQLSEAF